MTDIVIRVESLSKRYRLGTIGTGTLSHDLNRWWAQVRGKPDPLLQVGEEGNGNRQGETIWALRDVSFEVKQGEVLGIIGRNGAGKSTLLKILSRVTAPTSGLVKIKGRIASLLEIGTGFHPELTGRENIYLNGTILGMRKAEVARKFDEIVAFAEIEKFIDTPVKRYSSGMYVRLAFAVAAHLEPEILLVDEVLAVGDTKFQEKCLGKMSQVSAVGRTVLFVSHNLGAVQRLCPNSLLLDQGRIKATGTSAQTVQSYLALLKQADAPLPSPHGQSLSLNVRVLDESGQPTIVWAFDKRLIIEVSVFTRSQLIKPSVDIGFYTGSRMRLFSIRSDRFAPVPPLLTGHWRVRFEIENPGITAPEMVFDVGLREGGGNYSKLLINAGTLSADHDTFPELAETDWLIHLSSKVEWSEMEWGSATVSSLMQE